MINQLDNVEVISGKLRVNLCETTDGDDYKLQFWVEKIEQKEVSKVDKKFGILKQLWIDSGPLWSFLIRRLCIRCLFLDYQLDLFEKARVQLKGSEVFFRQALALIGEVKFNELLAEAKATILEGQIITKSETQRLIYRIKESLL